MFPRQQFLSDLGARERTLPGHKPILAKPGHVFLSGSVLLTWDIKRCDTELDGSYNLVLVSNNAYYENLFVYGAMSDTNYRLTS